MIDPQHVEVIHFLQKQQGLVAALNHPLRVHLLSVLTCRVASPSEIAKELKLDVGVVNYHARKLEKLGMVEIVRERPVRGSTEHFYKATARPWWNTDQWSRVDPKVKTVATAWALDALMGDAASAFNGGTFDSRDERHLSRTPMVLDQEGWRKVNEILDQTLEAIIQESANATERMAKSGEDSFTAIVGLLSFEMSPNETPTDADADTPADSDADAEADTPTDTDTSADADTPTDD